MQSFRDPVTGVLKAYGFATSNAPGDLAQDEADDFALEPGKWQLVDGAWVANTPTLAEQQATMWERIKAKRDELRFDGGVEIGTNWFLSTAQAVSEYTALSIIGAGAPGTTILRAAWRTMVDGVTVDMTPDLVKQILSAGFTQVAAIDDASLKHKAAMEAAADPTAYDFTGGWPATFQG